MLLRTCCFTGPARWSRSRMGAVGFSRCSAYSTFSSNYEVLDGLYGIL